MNKNLHFVDGKFKIMQIADTQENAVVNPDTIKLITLAIEKEKPNLIVFTGDQIKGYSSSFKPQTLKAVRGAISCIIQPVIDSGTPFIVTFGNHDNNCGIGNSTQMDIYKEYDLCYVGKERDRFDKGTYSLQILSSDEKEKIFNLYVFDSNSKEADGSYSPVSTQQIEWYKNERERIKDENGKYLPSIVFQHIPLPEYYNIIKKVEKGTKGAVEAFYSHSNEFYVLDDDVLKMGGFMGESPATPDKNNGEFDALNEKGEVLGVFVGHDHNNSFVKNYKGIDLGYTQGCGFNTYGPGKNRGVRIFELDDNDLKNYKTHTVTFGELTDDKPTKLIQEFVLIHAPTSVKQIKPLVKKFLIGVCIVTGTAIGIKKIFKK